MKRTLTLIIIMAIFSTAVLSLSGCKAIGSNGAPPTTQQVLDAQQGNATIAFIARQAFNIQAARIELARSEGKTIPAALDTLEDSMKRELDTMDTAAKGDPNQFASVVFKQAAIEADIDAYIVLLELASK